ncbi:MAG: hypothetical protein IJR93_08820 [Treponema sp.]|nr:hypothetical protein [Treponema sp.]MBQ7167029.1 hypothetical protein [Treponema sp.]
MRAARRSPRGTRTAARTTCRSHGIDKLQWSVVHDITGKTGRIWPHRRPEDGWDSGL